MEYAGAVIICGLLIVFAVLIILIGVVMATGRLVNKAALPGKSAVQKKPVVATLPVADGAIPQETVAVISAAVAAYMEEQAPGSAYAITAVQRAKGSRPVWGFAGMQQNTRPF